MKTKCLQLKAHEFAGIENDYCSQIRRLVTPQPEPTPAQGIQMPVTEFMEELKKLQDRKLTHIHVKGAGTRLVFPKWPYQPGDILWVKATHKQRMAISFDGRDHYRYFQNVKQDADTWLRVTGIRVEQLHSMTSEDSMKMGIQHYFTGQGFVIPLSNFGAGKMRTTDVVEASIIRFNITYHISRSDNPFVWVIDFEPTTKPESV